MMPEVTIGADAPARAGSGYLSRSYGTTMNAEMLDSAERSMLSWLGGQRTGLVDFACQLISTPSPNPPGDEQAVVAVAQAKLRELGIALVLVLTADKEAGSTDATYFQLGSATPTVAAFGPVYLSRAHQPNESLPVGSLLQAAEIYALTAMRYLGAYE